MEVENASLTQGLNMGSRARQFALQWSAFCNGNRAAASKLHTQALMLCEAMTSDVPGDQVSKMIATETFSSFQKLIIEHRVALGLETYSDREIALWVRTVCFCSTMKAEQQA